MHNFLSQDSNSARLTLTESINSNSWACALSHCFDVTCFRSSSFCKSFLNLNFTKSLFKTIFWGTKKLVHLTKEDFSGLLSMILATISLRNKMQFFLNARTSESVMISFFSFSCKHCCAAKPTLTDLIDTWLSLLQTSILVGCLSCKHQFWLTETLFQHFPRTQA